MTGTRSAAAPEDRPGEVEADTLSPAGSSQAAERVSLALSVRGVDAGYGRTTVVRGASIDVDASGISVLLGSNGAGKTTFLNAIAGFLPVRAGQIHLFGEDITRLPQHKRARLGICHVREGRAVYRSLTVRDNLRMQAAPGAEKQAVERAADEFPSIAKRINATAGTMSGGEQQMLAMAAAYVRDNRLIVVDEPSLGLAPVMIDKIYEFLKTLVAGGVALLLVDQYVTRALELADRAYIMRRGKIVYDGAAKELKADEIFEHYIGSDRRSQPAT